MNEKRRPGRRHVPHGGMLRVIQGGIAKERLENDTSESPRERSKFFLSTAANLMGSILRLKETDPELSAKLQKRQHDVAKKVLR